MEIAIAGEASSMTLVLRVTRFVRVVRLIRIVRIIGAFRELRLMIFGLLSSAQSLFWSIVFLGIVMYFFSIIFLQAVFTYVRDHPDDDDLNKELFKKFGNVFFTMR